jgi:hypothetical protein
MWALTSGEAMTIAWLRFSMAIAAIIDGFATLCQSTSFVSTSPVWV